MDQAYLGEIRMFGFNFAPVGWAQCEGQLLPIAQYTALFSLLGTIYGGDGRTTFALPDLRGHAPVTAQGVALNCCIALQGIYPPRN
jgi:microcystin-dependent protein